MARRPEFLRPRAGAGTELVHGDVRDPVSLRPALEGVETAYYLIHSMGSTRSFEEQDRDGARAFGEAARAAGVRRIVYLGGLGEQSTDLSAHLRSRHEVGEILRASCPQVIEFRASIIIGSGSLSFEMKPIAMTDVLAYLLAALELPAAGHRTFEIGGADRVSYAEIMRAYAQQRGLTRFMIRVPVLTPRLSSLWLGLVTPLYARVGRKLIDSIRHPTVVTDPGASTAFPIRPKGIREAIREALSHEDQEFGATRWSDALSATGSQKSWGGVRLGTRLVDSRAVEVDVPPSTVFAVVERIGGANGWYYADWLWQVRGWLDLLAGGVGMRRGRRDPQALEVGDALDCWRVEAIEPDRRVRLLAEMRLPGRAWLEFETELTDSGTRIHQTAIFDPFGLMGLAYWYLVYPLHKLVFAGMLAGIGCAARRWPHPPTYPSKQRREKPR
jgi:uncharacterized protein YbjT (DUF2867 family)